jgi:magnesium chelatase family protein
MARRGSLNARLADSALWDLAVLEPDARRLVARAVDRWQLSMRGCARVLKVALTIADLEDADRISTRHVGEALQLRCLDRRV